jgi:cutinase
VAVSIVIATLTTPTAGAQPAVPAVPAPPAPSPPLPVALGPAPGPVPLPAAAPAPSAAPGCPDVEVVFARGTTEAPGLGAMGQAFVDDLRSRLGGKSLGVYAVDYPASPDFPTAIQGISDASTHVQEMAMNCPDTKMVLGGYSQGAAVMGFVTTELIPDGVSASEVPAPMPADIATHVSAVTLLGTPSDRFMNVIKQPSVSIGPLYEPKTLELCVPNDFVCSAGNDIGAHARYVSDGLVMQAADFAATKVIESASQD